MLPTSLTGVCACAASATSSSPRIAASRQAAKRPARAGRTKADARPFAPRARRPVTPEKSEGSAGAAGRRTPELSLPWRSRGWRLSARPMASAARYGSGRRERSAVRTQVWRLGGSAARRLGGSAARLITVPRPAIVAIFNARLPTSPIGNADVHSRPTVAGGQRPRPVPALSAADCRESCVKCVCKERSVALLSHKNRPIFPLSAA